jgi:aldehyde dehydrogenase (NAD+)
MLEDVLDRLGIEQSQTGVFRGRSRPRPTGEELVSFNPATGQPLGRVLTASRDDYEQLVEQSVRAFGQWRMVPAPQRGEFVRRLGDALRRHKKDLGMLVTLEAGKILSEGLGEVQEMIDMCDLATGLSRQLHGLTMPSERPAHRLLEQWHPLGPVAIITAFNFPVAVWAWNFTVASVCGDTCVWKPSSYAPLCAVAVQNIVRQVAAELNLPEVASLCIGLGSDVGKWMAEDRRFPLVSATGSCTMGRKVAEVVARRLGRTLLELGGNNAVIVCPSANLALAVRAVVFAAVGTAGQRCTTLRRLIVHNSVADRLIERLVAAYRSITIGNPWEEGVLMGPLIHEHAVNQMMDGLKTARAQGGEILYGGGRIDRPGYFVQPTLVAAGPQMPIVAQETFAPILYVLRYDSLEEAVHIHNNVPQGLSSGIFTGQVSEAEYFLSAAGSDCGIANVNVGTSGAEIGGAFGGEKDSGGGREAGSDSWKAYMRRQTCTINYGQELPLAQGVEFDLRQ